MSKTEWPKADVTKVLVEYSSRMKKLLEDPDAFYSPKKRPSGHDVSTGFGKRNEGAIPPNLLQIANSESNGAYLKGCKAIGARPHPARFPAKLPEFFIKLLTDPGDLVVDIFAGSNTTGAVAELEDRRWLAFEDRVDYLASSAFRFLPKSISEDHMARIYERIAQGETLDLSRAEQQARLFW